MGLTDAAAGDEVLEFGTHPGPVQDLAGTAGATVAHLNQTTRGNRVSRLSEGSSLF